MSVRAALPRSAVFALAVLALVQAWVAFGLRRVGGFGVETDFYGAFAPRARDILDGAFDPARYGVTGPLYDLFLAAGMALGADAYLVARIGSVTGTVVAAAVWTWIAGRVFGPAVVRWTAWLFLLSPGFLRHGSLASTDAPYLALAALGVAAVVAAGTTAAQQVLRGTLDTIAARTAAAGLEPPALLFVGEAVGAMPAIPWFAGGRLRPAAVFPGPAATARPTALSA